MTSEDVLHSFFVPAFRTKQDVVPGRYTTTWFTATKAGRYQIFCSQYCGTNHSAMIGWVYAMEPKDYQIWLGGSAAEGSLADNGKALFSQLACDNCHKPDNSGRCPNLIGLFSQPVKLVGGSTVKADEAYIRESILQPQSKIVAGYDAVMPTFQGLVTEDQVLQLVEYIKSLGPKPGTAPAESSPKPAKKSRTAGSKPVNQ
jgi:cytochrome c oxidase subunit 2